MSVSGTRLEDNNIDKKDASSSKRNVDYDDLLSAAGEFGLYQWIMFFATGPFYIFGGYAYFSQLFITEASPNHWCWIPELENLTDIERRSVAIPPDSSAKFGYSQCEAYVANWSEVLENVTMPNNSTPTLPCQFGWEFNKTEIPYPTISSEMGWVCGKSSYQATAQSIFFVGSIVGGFIIGWIADRFGRLLAATCSNVIGCIAGIATIYVTNFTEFTICRFFVGMAYDNCMMMAYLLILEYSAPKYRTLIANLSFAIFFTTGLTTLPWIALACGHWKTFAIATSTPLSLAVLAPFLFPESPRWLLSKGRVDESVNKALVIAKINKKKIPLKTIQEFKSCAAKNTDDENMSVLELLKRPLLRRLFICICLEYMCTMLIFDIAARTINQLNFDFFLSFTLVSLTELPSLVLLSFILDLTGRRWLSIVTMIICAIASVLTGFVSNGLVSVTCAVVTRFTVNMAANTGMQWCAELLPANFRGSGVAFIHICGYASVVIAPFIADLDAIVEFLPFLINGLVAVLCAVLAFMLPETAGKEMPQTFEATEKFMKDKTFWDFPKRTSSR